jgi:hypothetical protein
LDFRMDAPPPPRGFRVWSGWRRHGEPLRPRGLGEGRLQGCAGQANPTARLAWKISRWRARPSPPYAHGGGSLAGATASRGLMHRVCCVVSCRPPALQAPRGGGACQASLKENTLVL